MVAQHSQVRTVKVMPKGQPAKIITKTCPMCEQTFETKQLANNEKMYCSSECLGIARGSYNAGKLRAPCVQCGGSREGSNITGFCSRACLLLRRAIRKAGPVECIICGTPFTAYYDSMQYCTRACGQRRKPAAVMVERVCERDGCEVTFSVEHDSPKRFCTNGCGSKRGSRERHPDLIEDYFDEVDTTEKAYWLGFLYADGNVSQNGYSMALKLALKDEERIDAFGAAIGADGIKYYRAQGQVALHVGRKRFCDGLVKQGCGPAKTTDIRLPQFSSDALDLAFLLGYFDGDGWRQGARSAAVCSGSQAMLADIKVRWRLPSVIKQTAPGCWAIVLGVELYEKMQANYTDSMPRKRNDNALSDPHRQEGDAPAHDGAGVKRNRWNAYDTDFKARAVALATAPGARWTQVAREFRVANSTLAKWIKDAAEGSTT
jgi:hypothetical protein